MDEREFLETAAKIQSARLYDAEIKAAAIWALGRIADLEVERDDYKRRWKELHAVAEENVRLREILIGVRYYGDHDAPCYCVTRPKTDWHELMCKRAKAALALTK